MTEPSIWRTPPGEKPEGDLVDQLTDYGREKMLRELLAALAGDQLLDGMAESVARVAESYRRTAIIRSDPDFVKIKERIGKTPEELGERTYTSEELRRELRLDEERGDGG